MSGTRHSSNRWASWHRRGRLHPACVFYVLTGEIRDMKKSPTLYRYTLLIFILLSVVMFAANVFFYQYNVKQIQKHRSEQVETAADYLKNWVEMHFVQMHLYTRELFQCPDLRFLQNPELFPAWEFYDGVKNLQSRMNFPATSDELDKNTYLIIKNKNILLTGSEMMPLYESGIYEGISELGTIRRLRLYPVDGKLYLIDFPQIYQQTIAVDDASVLLCVEIDQNVLIQYAVYQVNRNSIRCRCLCCRRGTFRCGGGSQCSTQRCKSAVAGGSRFLWRGGNCGACSCVYAL